MAQNEAEIMHWADQAAKKVIKERGEKENYTVAAGITPSGTIHIGNFREIITCDLVNRALKSLGKKVRFIYSWDDFDVFRKVPIDAPEKEVLLKYLRHPITEVPDTYDHKHASYAEHNEKEVEETIPKVDIHPKFLYQAKKYRNCEYAEEIRNVLTHKDEIKKILDTFRTEERQEGWWPVSVFCDKCKTDETKILGWDGDFHLTYECKCGHKETFDFRKKGIAKLPWRLDWPMRWKHEDVDFEPGGKEHSTAGGSQETAAEIFKHLYKKEPPVYLKYDFITIKGAGGKISKSKGNVVSLGDTLEVYEPEIVRYLFASTRPDAEFAISFDLDAIKIYEDFERCERIYYRKKEADAREYSKQKRIYEFSAIKINKEMPIQPSFRHLASLYQIYNGDKKKVFDYFKHEIKTEYDKERLSTRIGCVINWLLKYAPEDFKFTLLHDVPQSTKKELSDAQKNALLFFAEKLKEKEYLEEELSSLAFAIIKETGLKAPEFFSACYKVLINKTQGPKLAGFLLTIGKDKAAEMFKKASS